VKKTYTDLLGVQHYDLSNMTNSFQLCKRHNVGNQQQGDTFWS